jgi:hypothetical protein
MLPGVRGAGKAGAFPVIETLASCWLTQLECDRRIRIEKFSGQVCHAPIRVAGRVSPVLSGGTPFRSIRMSKSTLIVERFAFGRQALVLATLAMVSLGVAAPVVAQETAEKTVGERLNQYWEKIIARMESGANAAGNEYHKLKDEAAKASGPARAKMSAEMEVISKKWAVAREKLATTVELRMRSLGEEYETLEEKANKATGPARAKMAAELEKLHQEWSAARAKMEATLSSNLESSREEIEHLKQHVSRASEDAKAKLGPRLDRLKSEFHKNRERLAEYLEADLKQTREDMEKLGEATSNTAKLAKEKLSKKFHELGAKIEQLAREKKSEESN